MCYSPKISLITYIIGIIGCIVLLFYKENYKAEAMFFAWVIHMQMIDFILWKNQPCNDINKHATKIGSVINNMEPIILYIAIILFSSKKLSSASHILMIFYILFAFLYTMQQTDVCTSTTADSSPYLYWAWNYMTNSKIFYIFFIIVMMFISVDGIENGYILAPGLLITWLISLYIYDYKHIIGSMWCFFAAFAPILLPYIYKIKNNII